MTLSLRAAAFRCWTDGKIIGAVGCSGGTGSQDQTFCEAAGNAVK